MGKYSGLSGWLQSALFLKLISFTTMRATIYSGFCFKWLSLPCVVIKITGKILEKINALHTSTEPTYLTIKTAVLIN